MRAPATMPVFESEPRPGSFLSVAWLVEGDGCVILPTVTVVAAKVVEENFGGREVEVEMKEIEFEASEAEVDNTEMSEIESLFN